MSPSTAQPSTGLLAAAAAQKWGNVKWSFDASNVTNSNEEMRRAAAIVTQLPGKTGMTEHNARK